MKTDHTFPMKTHNWDQMKKYYHYLSVIALVCYCNARQCSSEVEFSAEQLKFMKKEWYEDYAKDVTDSAMGEEQNSTEKTSSFEEIKKHLWQKMHEIKHVLLEWIHNVFGVNLRHTSSFRYTKLYFIGFFTTAVIVIVVLLLLGLFCQTGFGCCCCKWMAKFPVCFCCDLKRTEEKFKVSLLHLVPGIKVADNNDIVSVYEPSEEEILAFRDAIDKLQQLRNPV